MRKLIDEGNAGETTLTARQHNILVSLDEALEDIGEAEQMAI